MITIGKAKLNDLPEILVLQRLCYQSEADLVNDYSIPPLTQTLEDLEIEYAMGIIFKGLDTDTGRIIGSVRGHLVNNTLHIGKLMVHPDYQNRGIGKQLLNHIESNYPNVRYELYTSNKSTKNIKIYESQGYRPYKKESVSEVLEMVFLEK